jgi:hypothetical protein
MKDAPVSIIPTTLKTGTAVPAAGLLFGTTVLVLVAVEFCWVVGAMVIPAAPWSSTGTAVGFEPVQQEVSSISPRSEAQKAVAGILLFRRTMSNTS